MEKIFNFISQIEPELSFLYWLLDNTFIGTLLAGIFISYYGINLYKKQKKIDYLHKRYDEYILFWKEKSDLLEEIYQHIENAHIGDSDYPGHENNLVNANKKLSKLFPDLFIGFPIEYHSFIDDEFINLYFRYFSTLKMCAKFKDDDSYERLPDIRKEFNDNYKKFYEK